MDEVVAKFMLRVIRQLAMRSLPEEQYLAFPPPLAFPHQQEG